MTGAKEASRRWMYRGKRRNRVAAVLNRVDATTAAAGLRRSRLKGHDGMKIWTGWAILAYDLDTLAIRTR